MIPTDNKLTDKGRAVKDDVNKIVKDLEETAFAGFSVQEKVLLRRFFLQKQSGSVVGSRQTPQIDW